MALPVTIPNTFANATASIPLSQLDTNFNTLANAVNGISDGSETLANASVTVLTAGTVDINGGAIDGTTVGTSNAAAGSFTTLNTSGAVVFNDAGADVDFRVEGDTDANLLFVDASTDRVGIGTSSLGSKLHVSTSGTAEVARFETTTDNTPSIGIWSNGAIRGKLRASTAETALLSQGALPLLLGTNDTERARITSGGTFLVGTTSAATANLAEFYKASGDAITATVTGSISNGQQSAVYAIGGSRQTSLLTYKHAGITNPCGALNVQCEDSTQNYLWADNSDVLRISTSPADIGTTGGTVVGTQTSDERLKNISGTIAYGLNAVLSINPISFTMKDDPNTSKIGFSAQQIQSIVPEAVYDTGECIDGYDIDPENKMLQTPKSDRTKLAMDYTQLIPVLVNAVKELKAELDKVKAELATLKGQ